MIQSQIPKENLYLSALETVTSKKHLTFLYIYIYLFAVQYIYI